MVGRPATPVKTGPDLQRARSGTSMGGGWVSSAEACGNRAQLILLLIGFLIDTRINKEYKILK